jgi:hypothetical protein
MFKIRCQNIHATPLECFLLAHAFTVYAYKFTQLKFVGDPPQLKTVVDGLNNFIINVLHMLVLDLHKINS